MNSPSSRGMIGFRTAMFLFALLAVTAVVKLRGVALALALIIVVGLAAKACLHYLRGRTE